MKNLTRKMVVISVIGTEVRFSGNLNTQTVTEAFNNSPDFSAPLYSVDLQEVDEVDSAGLALLVYLKTRADASESEIKFINLPDKLHQLATLGGLGSLFIDG